MPVARAVGVLGLLACRRAEAQEGPDLPPPGQPKTERAWLQYGAALVSEGRARAGNVCPDDATVPCILGSGGGLAMRAGRRSASWFFGGAYEFSRQDAANLLRLPILQQLRGEGRYYLMSDRRLDPYVLMHLGFATYGGEWGISTYGPLVALGGGVEFETSRGIFIGSSISYRVLQLAGWRDKAGQERPNALAHFISLEVTLEVRKPVARW